MNDTGSPGQSRLPSVDQVLRTDVGATATARFGHKATVNAVRRILSGLREVARDGGSAKTDAAAIAA